MTTINQVNFVGNNGIYFNNHRNGKLNNNKIINFYEKNKKQKYRVGDLLLMIMILLINLN
jgi:hypothetical protein